MGTEPQETTKLHGGRLMARRLKAHGVTTLFTLSGGHLFSIYDGCRTEGTTASARSARRSRTTRRCSSSAGAPRRCAGGRARCRRSTTSRSCPLVKLAATASSSAEIPGLIDDAWAEAIRPHSGPTFLDFPLDHTFMEAEEPEPAERLPHAPAAPDGPMLVRAVTLLRDAERPVIMAGTDLYWGHGEDALRELAEAVGIPVFLNGLGRGCLPADHPLFYSRARGAGLKAADVALLVGVPLDFRLGFGRSFGEDCELIALDVAEP